MGGEGAPETGDVLAPEDPESLAAAVREAAAGHRALEVRGAGSKRGFGRPVEAEAVVTTARLTGIDLYEPEELVMTARAGTPLAEVAARLAENRQELAFEPADYGWITGGREGAQTIGGVFACNLSGPRRFKAGAARDHLLGLRCVTGRGELVRSGGRVMKNVTGYDLCKLLCGSFGTLAVLTEVTFKVLPAAEAVGTLVIWGVEEAGLLGLLRRATGTPFDVSGAAVLTALAAGRSTVAEIWRPGAPLALLRVEGPQPSVDYRLARLEQALARPDLRFMRIEDASSRRLWREIRDLRLLPRERVLWRMSIPPRAASELASWFAELTPERLYDWAGGLVWLAAREVWADAAATMRRALRGRGGHLTLVRAPEEMRRSTAVFEPEPPPLFALTRRVKAAFDPLGILNPGRMYAEL